jgi:hypothetical protein
MHEAQMHERNSFLTLTYDQDHLASSSLQYRDYQLFMKRLRKHARQPGLRFYMAGEYGERYRRPHFHACIFGYDFADKTPYKKSPSGFQIYKSLQLNKLWPYGTENTIGEVNFQTAAYTARYVMKKITGDPAEKHYEQINDETGEIEKLKPEFNQMSRRPGIGQTWLQKYTADVYPEGKMVVNGNEVNSPRYYDKKFKKQEPTEYELMKFHREMEAIERWRDNTESRLKVKQQVKNAAIKQLKRTID